MLYYIADAANDGDDVDNVLGDDGDDDDVDGDDDHVSIASINHHGWSSYHQSRSIYQSSIVEAS